ncbi:MAG: hypothetical protein KIC92_06785 [Clostridiales bacterium]|nr:hypothetical protein [Clostridiales bacterium]
MDYNKLFEQEAFKAIDRKVLDDFKVLISNLNGKSTNEMMLQIMNFYRNMPKGTSLSKEESDALIKTISLNMPKEEREKFLNMLSLISNLI